MTARNVQPESVRLGRLRRRERKTSPAPTAMKAPPEAASVPLIPGPVPPPVAGAPAGPLVVAAVAPGVADGVEGVEPAATATGQTGVVPAVLAGVAVKFTRVQSSQCGCVFPSGSQAIGVPFAATPDVYRSAVGQNSPAL